ncbi:tetratricopeptide repeat protein [Leptospira sp. GIMC2001]|uniref:tetratricopeptide repeat protein n=1 Tax=Leptospira sp. GIMC2001 TaxID=1513297 RepID=UPI00234B7C41|nr:tetratricopeptide repeat protein [Leptospira sp. GIMC2001]WCL48739.1 tetratricopeptide repeat protein [Leptospira sp. GIMC2001]
MNLSAEMKQVFDLYNEGLHLYKTRKFPDAKRKFQEALQIKPDDGPSQLYVERCDTFIQSPPPEDWDGVYVMTTK